VKIDLVYPTLPPELNGVGDHTAHLSAALADFGCQVRVITEQVHHDPIQGVSVHSAFSLQRRAGILALAEAVESTPPDWLVIQFEPFSYGHWGYNPYLPLALYRAKRAVPSLKLAVLFHEVYMFPHSVKTGIMTLSHLPQFWLTGLLADVALFAVETWADRYARWFPQTVVGHLPVGSNMPRMDADPAAVRRHLGISPDAFVVGLFGSAHPSRLLRYVDRALAPVCKARADVHLLYVGPDGAAVRRALSDVIPMTDTGPLPGTDVSRCFSVMDLYLAPFREGVSARRGSFLAGVQHGVATVSTRGRDTGGEMLKHSGTAFRLSPADDPDHFASSVATLIYDADGRARVAREGQRYYDSRHAWTTLADTLLRSLSRVGRPAAA